MSAVKYVITSNQGLYMRRQRQMLNVRWHKTDWPSQE